MQSYYSRVVGQKGGGGGNWNDGGELFDIRPQLPLSPSLPFLFMPRRKQGKGGSSGGGGGGGGEPSR